MRARQLAPPLLHRCKAALARLPPLTHAHTYGNRPHNARRHQLALYFNLTGIKWDYSVEHALEGYISPTNGLPPRVLRIDPRGMSPLAIADKLWAEVGEAFRLP